MSDLVVASQAEQNRLAELAGFSTGGSEQQSDARLPILKINYDDEDDDGNDLKKGLLTVTGQEVSVYCNEVTVRPLTQFFQWLDYSPEANDGKGGTVNKTLLISDFRQEARDEKGTVRCGKPTSKYLKENPDQKDLYKSITCFRYVHCLVSGKGKTATGEASEFENIPALLRMKGSSFNVFEDQFTKVMPRGSKPWDYTATLSTEKHKMGSVVYFTYKFEPDFKNKLPLDTDTIDTIEYILETVSKENGLIERKYKEALSNSQDGEWLEADLVDDAELA